MVFCRILQYLSAKSVCLGFTLFCREICFGTIYALLCGEKFSRKLCPWRKNDKYEVCTSVKVAPTTPSTLLPCRINHEILGGGLSANQCTWRTTSSRNCFLPQEFVFFSQQNCFLPPELSTIFSSHIPRFVQNGKCFEISSSRIIKSQQSLCEQI